MGVLLELEKTLLARKQSDPDKSYVASMCSQGLDPILRKLGEEAVEVVLAGRDLALDRKAQPELVHEAADLLFHLLLLLAYQKVPFEDVLEELRCRQGRSGLAEKAARQ